ncbi:MAG TPA: hypothetical protein VNZ06_08460 [Steroidobacteraceae bacterium]|jgi:hypothetical protein|nr:hypothetical protein [Steroidobacteraceae bacterium]
MHKCSKLALAVGAVVALMNLSGCIVAERDHDHGPYTWEHGDRIDHYGHREAGWCDRHHEDEHCR